eukprot:CAMPEP_0119377156 /NCGR_PEP_ID=MMETSP1334-20130426/43466_1 /TAXON_ID=127549 /ORGANISM="Calcidiscus leptoporus, Strain RCC1130" /LENGTH=80 /DNA_ID=CAMNT_0007395967 /DNA_START=44 /DNA_END=283 /DNA_ORIENTATION=-
MLDLSKSGVMSRANADKNSACDNEARHLRVLTLRLFSRLPPCSNSLVHPRLRPILPVATLYGIRAKVCPVVAGGVVQRAE